MQTAANGHDALEALSAGTPELIIVDWVMPNVDGPSLIQSLRHSELFKSIPIIMLTVKQKPEEELGALNIGVDDFLCKPFQEEELLARVNAVLRRATRAH